MSGGPFQPLTFRPWVIQFSSSDFLIYFSLLFPLELLLFRCPPSLDNYAPPTSYVFFYFFLFPEKCIFQCLSSNCHLYPVVHEWSFFVVFVYFFFKVISTPMWSSNLLPGDQGSHAPWTESARHPHIPTNGLFNANVILFFLGPKSFSGSLVSTDKV